MSFLLSALGSWRDLGKVRTLGAARLRQTMGNAVFRHRERSRGDLSAEQSLGLEHDPDCDGYARNDDNGTLGILYLVIASVAVAISAHGYLWEGYARNDGRGQRSQ